MQYIKLTVPQHIYEKLGLHSSQTLVLSRSKDISGLGTHENTVSTSRHCDEPVLTAPEIDDASEENESSHQSRDSTFQAIHRNPSYARNSDIKIHYPRTCENCNKKYFRSSSYFSHRKRCLLKSRIQKASFLDSSSGLNMIPEAFHTVGYDTAVLAEPEINNTTEENESSQANASSLNTERFLGSSDDSNMIPEAFHAVGYDTAVLAEPEINNTTEENESTQANASGLNTERFLGSSDDSIMIPEALHALGYDTPLLTKPDINDANEENEFSLQKHDDTSRIFLNPSNIDAGNVGCQDRKTEYPKLCPLCKIRFNSSYMYYKHIKSCRSMHGLPNFAKKKAVVRYYTNDCNSDSSDDSYMTPGELRALGYDTPETNKSNEGTSNQSCSESLSASQGMNTNAHNASNCRSKIVYPRKCEKCFRSYGSKRSFWNHKARCSAFVALRLEELSRQEIQDTTVGKDATVEKKTIVQRALVVFDSPNPEINKMKEREASSTGNEKEIISCRRICLNCCRSYANKYGFKRHLRSCDYFKKIGQKKEEGYEDYTLRPNVPKYRKCKLPQVELVDTSAKEDNRVNWIPVSRNPTKVLKYFVTNRSSS